MGVTRARNSVNLIYLKKKERMMEAKSGQSVQSRRDAMPVVSAFVDLMRSAYGAGFVDAQMVKGQQARREYLAVLQEQGTAAATRWHKANEHRCTFWAEEGGRTLGMPSAYGVQASAQQGA